MVPFDRVVDELRALYQMAQEFEPEALFDTDEPCGWRPAERWEVLARYDELLAEAATMLGAPCPPLPPSRADRLWLEEVLVELGLDVRAPSAR